MVSREGVCMSVARELDKKVSVYSSQDYGTCCLATSGRWTGVLSGADPRAGILS